MSTIPADASPPAQSEVRGLPRGLVVLLGLAATVVVIAGMTAASGLIGPAFLALVLTITTQPVRKTLDRFLPTWAASLACLLMVYLLVVGLALSLVLATTRFASLIPTYEEEFNSGVDDLTARLDAAGVGTAQIETLNSSLDLHLLTDILTSVLSGAIGVLSNLVFILALVLFMVVDGGRFPRHLATAAGSHPALVGALVNFTEGTRRYLVVSTAFGLVVAILDTIALLIMGIPAALLWGLLAFLTNYIPNIGFVIGLVPPAILALLEGGPGLMLGVIVVYCALNIVIQSVLQPRIVGEAVGLSTTLTFMSLVFWTWVLGPLGAILAIPLSLLVKALLVDADPRNQWLVPLVANSDGDPSRAKGARSRARAARTAARRESPTPVDHPRDEDVSPGS